MVDFKYHVVSIVAVFLALAIGIVLGTNVLSGDVLRNLKAETSQLRKEAQTLRTQGVEQQTQIGADNAFAQALEPVVVSGRLTGRQVVVIVLPSVDKSVRDQTMQTLTDAGAIVTGEVDISSSFADPAQAPVLGDLVSTLAPSSIGATATQDVSSTAASMLASALVGPAAASQPNQPVISAQPADRHSASGSAQTRDVALALRTSPSPSPNPTVSPSARSRASASGRASGRGSASGSASASASASVSPASRSASARPGFSPSRNPGQLATPSPTAVSSELLAPPVDSSSAQILAGLAKAGFIKVDQTPSGTASLALVLAPAAPAKPAPDQVASTAALLDLVGALPPAGADVVLAGVVGSAGADGLVAALRNNAPLSKVVSGLDDVDTANGQIAAVLALQSQAGGQVGQYGTGAGAQAPLPAVTALTSVTSPGSSTAPSPPTAVPTVAP